MHISKTPPSPRRAVKKRTRRHWNGAAPRRTLVIVDGESEINRALEARGYPTEFDLDDETEIAAHMGRVLEVLGEIDPLDDT